MPAHEMVPHFPMHDSTSCMFKENNPTLCVTEQHRTLPHRHTRIIPHPLPLFHATQRLSLSSLSMDTPRPQAGDFCHSCTAIVPLDPTPTPHFPASTAFNAVFFYTLLHSSPALPLGHR
uniref:Uncharacterized protein n=1 Tax=Trypanosoma vivax (strain Y486) TaxID=1055687 RepID=G0U9S2_TRYVY|nr:hypothetical protein, unlikely [Trypanosoma vivax Y486]